MSGLSQEAHKQDDAPGQSHAPILHFLLIYSIVTFMEILRFRNKALVTTLLSATALLGCSIESYLTNTSAVKCDGKTTIDDLPVDGVATFIVHGRNDGETGIVQVRRNADGVSVKAESDIDGPPQQLMSDGFTPPVPIMEGSELTTFAAGGAWILDARDDSVIIQGTCDGL